MNKLILQQILITFRIMTIWILLMFAKNIFDITISPVLIILILIFSITVLLFVPPLDTRN